ncbi:hypothetical protein pb186bvf_008065 [Paramecium bursaria]
MDKARKLQYQQEVENYLERNKVYHIFEDMLKSIVIKKPDDPIEFLIKKLQEPEVKKIFVVGPPGSQFRELALTLAEHLNYQFVSIGDIIKKELSKKNQMSQQIQDSINKFEYVKDDIVIQIAKTQLAQLESEKRNFIFEGFPKTRVQGLAFQKEGIIPDAFIILEMSEQKIQICCKQKLETETETYNGTKDKDLLAQNHTTEYLLNLKQVKEIYKNQYFSVDGEKPKPKTESSNPQLEDMALLLKYKIGNNAPSRAARILILGPPGSGRSTLAKQLSQRYGFVYVSTRELISNLVNQKGQTGRDAFVKMNKGELVDDQLMSALIKERLNQTDCQLQGYVLDGFPKTEQQLNQLVNLYINPTLLVLIDAQDDIILRRLTNRRIDPQSGIVYTSMDQASSDVRNRLTVAPNEQREVVQLRLKRWDELKQLIDISPIYASVIFKIPGDLNQNNMFESVCYHLEKIY